MENSGLAFNTFGGVELCHGKSGSISFHGLTHQLVEESKLMSAAFQEDKGSFLWVLAPIALISSLILPQFFFSSAIEAFFKDDTLCQEVGSHYRTQVYLSSSFFTMGFKVVAPLLAVFLTWPALGFQALVAVAPFLIDSAAQHAFKTILDKHQSSCWPLIPIIF
ncbi:hypothetical protein Goari_009246 [Gossypium aridum]|uniref:Uncharacterized protein n=1 Tax=Gossypium aridum TaxID=34290 RepID=A0A7J8XY09_GOSAI|nr:hypothetical protein [Gossypium aridum]